jgi:hypothetical protein
MFNKLSTNSVVLKSHETLCFTGFLNFNKQISTNVQHMFNRVSAAECLRNLFVFQKSSSNSQLRTEIWDFQEIPKTCERSWSSAVFPPPWLPQCMLPGCTTSPPTCRSKRRLAM